ncbi:MAG: 4a-hydroxytetrahydrobiopterin dehydratase [Anaerolineales bacterium]|nr:4a-hydroxytetrahydrobiopterin dehydratase [Anaerolineales bacterium]
MDSLRTMKCIPCSGAEPPLTEAESTRLLEQTPGWEIVERGDGIQRLERVFKFRNFAQALDFTNRVGALAEAEGHHPAILTQWGRVTVTWWTHKIKGLHQNDFVMAIKTDALAADQ